nr:hypothetical protein [Streptacidiphilus rugosus]
MGTDADFLDDGSQDALPVADRRGARVLAQTRQEALQVLGELEVGLLVDELRGQSVEPALDLLASGAEFRHAVAQFLEGNQVFLVGADQPVDRRVDGRQLVLQALAASLQRVGVAHLGQTPVQLGADQGGIGQQGDDALPDHGLQGIGPQRAAGADFAAAGQLPAVGGRAAVVVVLLRTRSLRGALVGVATDVADQQPLQQGGMLGVARGELRVLRQSALGQLEDLLADQRRHRDLHPFLARPPGHPHASGRRATGQP